MPFSHALVLLASCNFPPVIRMGQRKIAKNLKSPKMYIATFFVYYTREYLIPTEFDTRLEKKDIYCKVAKIPWNLLWNELENNSGKNAKNILCYLSSKISFITLICNHQHWHNTSPSSCFGDFLVCYVPNWKKYVWFY